jgi:hypothetical protein
MAADFDYTNSGKTRIDIDIDTNDRYTAKSCFKYNSWNSGILCQFCNCHF